MSGKTIAIAIVALLVISASAVLLYDKYGPNNGEGEYCTITDSRGVNVEFNEPAQKAAAFGVSFTTTLISLDCFDSMVMIDDSSYSSTTGISEMSGYTGAHSTLNGTNVDQVAQTLLHIDGFDKNRDVVIVNGYASTVRDVIPKLEAYGLKVVAFYPKSFDDGVSMVRDIGLIMDAADKAKEVADGMEDAKTMYLDVLEENGVTKKNAVYVSSSYNPMQIGNYPSYSVILMKMAGGLNPADDNSKTATTYQMNPGDIAQIDSRTKVAVVFLDGYYTGSIDAFRTEMLIPNDVLVVQLTRLMNQYGPTSVDGIRFMAETLYPDLFGTTD